MAQTRAGSLTESLVNILVGGWINWIATVLIVPVLWDAASPKLSAFYMTIFYTGVSFVRSYLLRRFFNRVRRFDTPVAITVPGSLDDLRVERGAAK